MKQLIISLSVILTLASAQAHEAGLMTPTEERINDCYSQVNTDENSQYYFRHSHIVDTTRARKFLNCQISKEGTITKQNPNMSTAEIIFTLRNSISKDLSAFAQDFEAIFK
jgi:hypothetical protein